MNSIQDFFDLNNVPPSLATEDGEEQSEVLCGINRFAIANAKNERDFEKVTPVMIRLDTYHSLYEKGQEARARQLLKKRVRVVVDEDHRYPAQDSKLMWHCNKFFVDYLLLVSKGIGLDAALPNLANDINYTFRMNLGEPIRAFPTKYAKLGFDPKGCMLFFGYQNNDKVWLAWAPRGVLRGEAEEVPAGTCS